MPKNYIFRVAYKCGKRGVSDEVETPSAREKIAAKTSKHQISIEIRNSKVN